jgi:hypothetical protein
MEIDAGNDKKPDEVWVQEANSVGAATAALIRIAARHRSC